MIIYIENSNYGYNYNPPEKQYGNWSKSNDITEDYLTSKNNSKENILVDFKPEFGDKLYLVKGVYTTGDSFGSETGRVEYLDIFQTYENAELFKEKIEQYNELIKDDWYGYNPKQKKDKIRNLKYLLKDNIRENKEWMNTYIFVHKGKDLHFPWGGYFERLNEIIIVELEFRN